MEYLTMNTKTIAQRLAKVAGPNVISRVMNAISEPAAFRRGQKMLETIFVTASDLKPEPNVALVTGGAILGFDDRVHIDLNHAHTVLSPEEARRFAAELKRMADAIDIQCLFSKSRNRTQGAVC